MMEETKAKRGVFTNALSNEKIVSRYHVIGHCKALLGESKIRALTLPANNFIFEKMIGQYLNISSITCVESNPKTYEEGIPNQPKGVSYINKNVFNHLLDTDETYNFIWLDLCSCISGLLIAELIELIGRSKIEDGCLFCLTVQKAREINVGKKYKVLNDYRTKGFPKELAVAANNVGKQCKLLEVYPYKSYNKVSAPMNIYIFQITKLS